MFCSVIILRDTAGTILKFTPSLQVSPEDKAAKEMAAFQELVKHLPSHVVGDLLGAFIRCLLLSPLFCTLHNNVVSPGTPCL